MLTQFSPTETTPRFTDASQTQYLDAELRARNTAASSIAFSAVSGAKANQLLADLLLTEVDGFAEAPFETPAGWKPHEGPLPS